MTVKFTAVSEDAHRVFFDCLIKVCRTVLSDKYHTIPTNTEEAKCHMWEFEMTGLPGCTGSFDATHVVHEKCSYWLNRMHNGCKSKHTTITFNLGANHHCQIYARSLVILDLGMRPWYYLTSFYKTSRQ